MSVRANYLSFDIEDWYQVPFVSNYIKENDWQRLPAVVVDGTEFILNMLARHNTTATFFIVGWIAERYPDLVKKIAAAGHEIGSHSYAHKVLDSHSPTSLAADTARSIEVLSQITGTHPLGYRAPLASIGPHNLWALDVLRDHGFKYDSSVYPANLLVYSGLKNVPSQPYEIISGLMEIPLSTARVAGATMPLSGGFYLRLLPQLIFNYLMQRKNMKQESVVLYYHSWEFATAYPRPITNPIKRFVQYYNLNSVAPKVEDLLHNFNFMPLQAALPSTIMRQA